MFKSDIETPPDGVFQSLQNLLHVERPANTVLGFRGETMVTWSQWRQRVEAWRESIAESSAERIGLYHEDAIEFSAILFAIMAQGKVACIPGNNQSLTTEALAQRVGAFIGEFPGRPTLSVSQSLSFEERPLLLDPKRLAIEVFTSGSSGEPQAIPKLLRQLSNEVNNLHSLWGACIHHSAVFATVSHHHIYGLLFRVLWPLAAMRPFDAAMANYLEDVNQRCENFARVVLISSPTHLSRIPALSDWRNLRDRCQAIFSSGAPLPRQASLETFSLFGHSPIEVFGSSETGGIAWRQQKAEVEVLWQAVPGVVCDLDEESECLRIRSPYLGNDDWFVTSDRVALESAQGFSLLGRADRIAKVEGKRLSLTEMERRLESHPNVEQARVVVLQTKRSEVAAVLILSDSGRHALVTKGRRALNQQFAEYLHEQFERPLLPRRWRYPQALPLNQQGKVEQQKLMELFLSAETEKPRLPEIVSETIHAVSETKKEAKFSLRIPDDLLYFEGHFAVAAILPGVVQLKWAEHYGRECMGVQGRFSHMEAIKFQHVIRPGADVEFSLAYDRANNKLSFNYHSDAGQHSSGRLVYRD